MESFKEYVSEANSKGLNPKDQEVILKNLKLHENIDDDRMTQIAVKADFLDDLSSWRDDQGQLIWKKTNLKSDEKGLYIEIMMDVYTDPNDDGSERALFVKAKNGKLSYQY